MNERRKAERRITDRRIYPSDSAVRHSDKRERGNNRRDNFYQRRSDKKENR